MARIVDLVVEETRVTAAEAVLTVTARLATAAAGVELRGKLVGPWRSGHGTIAVAYPLRPTATDDATASARVVIPEPNFWTTATPFRYDGIAELWNDGSKLDMRSFTVELKAK